MMVNGEIISELLQLRAQEMGKMRKGNLLNDLLSQRDKNGRTVLFHCLDCNSISGKSPSSPWSRKPMLIQKIIFSTENVDTSQC